MSITQKPIEPKYPDINVQLTDNNGNAYSIIALCQLAGRRAGLPREELNAFSVEATSDDYNHVLTTCRKWFDCQ